MNSGPLTSTAIPEDITTVSIISIADDSRLLPDVSWHLSVIEEMPKMDADWIRPWPHPKMAAELTLQCKTSCRCRRCTFESGGDIPVDRFKFDSVRAIARRGPDVTVLTGSSRGRISSMVIMLLVSDKAMNAPRS